MIRILIVDDQKTAREKIKSIFEAESDIEVVGIATDGYEAIRLAKTLAPDIVLMDLEMPNLDGLAATKLLCLQNLDINVIILTMQDSDDLLIQALNAGAKGYLLKNLSAREIIETVNLIYEGSRFTTSKLNRFGNKVTINIEKEPQKIKAADVTTDVNNKVSKDAYYLETPSVQQRELSSEQENYSFTRPSQPDFSSLLTILKRRYPPALMGFLGVLLGAILYLIFAQRTYQAVASISLEDRQESISELGKDLSSIPGSNEYSPLASQAELITSMPVIRTALDNAAQKKEGYFIRHISPNEVRDNLSVTVVPNTNILEVSYVHQNSELAALILSEIIDTVIAKNTNTIRSEASSVRQFLEREVNEQRQELSQLETSENRYRAQSGIVDLNNQTSNLVNSLNSLETQEQDLLTAIKEQEAKANNLQRITKVNDAESAYIQGKIGQDRQLENLRTQLTDVEAQLAAARSNFTDSNPTVIALQEKRAEILNLYQQQINKVLGEGVTVSPSELAENRLSQEENGISQKVFSELIAIQNQLDANREKLQAIRAEKAKLSDRINSLPANVQSLTELVRQREQANESLQFLQRKLEEASIAEAQLVSNIQIVELAEVPTSPSSPKIPFVLAIALIIGVIFATGIILLLETIDRTLYDGKEIEGQLRIPLLATLPNLLNKTINIAQIKLFLHDKELYEPYRSLLKRLESFSQQDLKVIVISSASAQEGKSTVAAHLGAVAAMLNRRTLIIDAHLNQSSQHYFFQVKHQPGLVEIVTDRLPLEKVVQSTEIPNLSVLAVGSSTGNSCAVVESPSIESLIQKAAMQYDLVIIDAPSTSSNCDAQTLAKYSEGLVMVTRPLYTTTDVLERTVIDLKRNKTPILGFVVNDAGEQKPLLKSDRDGIKQKLPLLLGSSEQTNNSHRNAKEVSQP
ncbi:polysaccharide biosynthesis tyrosine autokinase [Myxosarcina sp. GI1]|uniref:polysaccharide biosynthesis tyrosine autokinase n=1 Tax=Myxosarcina sp. GI1 TaxID=1541065 RepID=UPI00068EFE61|nr:polysaccharide biosynthesis tyrosine autokinase [Myxosarcina sp. GI1]